MKPLRSITTVIMLTVLFLPSCSQMQSYVGQSEPPCPNSGEGRVSVTRFRSPHSAVAEIENAKLPAVSTASGKSVLSDANVLAVVQQRETDSKLLLVGNQEDSGAGSLPPLPVEEAVPSDAEAMSGALTLPQLEEMALQSNPTLQQAAAVIGKAQGIREQVGLYPNPVIGYQSEEMGDDGTAGKQGGFVNQTIMTGGKLKLNRAVAQWDVEGLGWEYEAQRFRVLNDVKLRFYEVLGAQRRIEIATELANVAEEGVRIAEELFKAQQGARPDVLQARVDLNEVRILLENAQLEYEAAWKRLASILGRPELQTSTLAGKLEEVARPREWDELYDQLLNNSPELQAAYTRVERARTQIRRQEVQPIPNLLTGFGMAHDYASGDTVSGVQLGVALPLFNRNQGNLLIAQSELSRAARDVERLKLDLRNRLAAAYRDYRQAAQQMQKYQAEILPNAQENLQLTQEGYRQGEFDFLRVLTARRTFFESNLRYVSSAIALRQANVVLDGMLLTGGLNDVEDISRGMGGVGQREQAFGQQ